MKKQGGSVPVRVERLVRPVVEGMGLRLWDVRFEKEGAEWFLKVLIDRDEPMDTDTCEAAARAIDPLLDEEDPVDHAYILEVGSPGLGRSLHKPWHFEVMKGRMVRAKLYRADKEKRKEIVGVLEGKTEENLVLQTQLGIENVSLKEVADVKLCDDEDL